MQIIKDIEQKLKSFNESINNIYSDSKKIFNLNRQLDGKYNDLKIFNFFPQGNFYLINSKSIGNSNNINENESFQSNIEQNRTFIQNYNDNSAYRKMKKKIKMKKKTIIYLNVLNVKKKQFL